MWVTASAYPSPAGRAWQSPGPLSAEPAGPRKYSGTESEFETMSERLVSCDGSGLCSQCGFRTATVSISICPSCGGAIVAAASSRRKRKIRFFTLPSMLYQKAYKWFVYISALDVVLTWFILLLGGQEVNVVADAVIAHAGLGGILIYKFGLVVLVVLACEVIGRRRPSLGRGLAHWSIAVTAIPVLLSVIHLFSG